MAWEISSERSQIESILLVVDTPITSQELSQALSISVKDVDRYLHEIKEELDQRGSGIELVEDDAGAWRFYTRKINSPQVEKFILGGSQTKLSRAALETLAVVAYRQPTTRAQISAVRGVNVDGVMKTLQLRGLIRETAAEKSGSDNLSHGARLYETTELFLDLLGIDSLEELPDLAPLLPDIDLIDDFLE